MIITDEAILRMECTDVLPHEYGPLKEQLERELAHSAKLGMPGIGLAAPQIGIAKKIAIVRVGDDNVDLVNPKLIAGFDMTQIDGEGCLSFPNRFEKTNRYQIVHVETGISRKQFMAYGISAICCQHEMDHLIGRLLPDVAISQILPNELCLCGSGKKYKKCCKNGRKTSSNPH